MTQTSGSKDPPDARPADPPTAPPDRTSAGSADERSPEPPDAERAYERLAEDEALRRDLDDATFGPLLDLGASLAVALAGRFATTDALHGALRAFLVGAAEYARSGETADLAQGFGALIGDDEANRVWFSLGAGSSPEERAEDLARAVSRAVGLEETS